MTIFLTTNDIDLLIKASEYLLKNGFLNDAPKFDPLNEDEYKESAKKEGRNIWYGFIGIFGKSFHFSNNSKFRDIIILLTEDTFETSMKFAIEQSKISTHA